MFWPDVCDLMKNVPFTVSKFPPVVVGVVVGGGGGGGVGVGLSGTISNS